MTQVTLRTDPLTRDAQYERRQMLLAVSSNNQRPANTHVSTRSVNDNLTQLLVHVLVGLMNGGDTETRSGTTQISSHIYNRESGETASKLNKQTRFLK